MSAQNTSGKFPSVLGYITETERIALQRCVLDTAHIPGDAMEIGSLNGLSALLILSVLESHKTMICIEKGQTETLSENLVKCGYSEKTVILDADFNVVTLNPDEVKLSFIFIDHSHTYDDNIAAFEKFWSLLSPGGIFAFHDYGNPDYPEGTRAIDELMEQHSLTPDWVGIFISFKKP